MRTPGELVEDLEIVLPPRPSPWRSPRAWAKAVWRELLMEGSSPLELGAAVLLGVVVGTSPFYGLQTLLVILCAWVLRLNRFAALLAVQISIPPIYPFLVLASLESGNLLLHGTWLGIRSDELPETSAAWWALLADLAGVWLLGSLVVGVLLGLLCAAGVVAGALAWRRSRGPDHA